MSGDEIVSWRAAQVVKPQMTLRVGAPAQESLDAVAAALEGAKYSVKDRDEEGFTATYVDWIAVVGATLNRTTVEVVATGTADGSELLISADYVGEDIKAGKRAASGLTSAVRELRRRGVEVTATPWERRPGAGG